MNSGSFYRDGLPVVSCSSLDNLGSGQNALNSPNNSAAAGTTLPLGSSRSKHKKVHYDALLNKKLDNLSRLSSLDCHLLYQHQQLLLVSYMYSCIQVEFYITGLYALQHLLTLD